jgi:hypothetical protein
MQQHAFFPKTATLKHALHDAEAIELFITGEDARRALED